VFCTHQRFCVCMICAASYDTCHLFGLHSKLNTTTPGSNLSTGVSKYLSGLPLEISVSPKIRLAIRTCLFAYPWVRRSALLSSTRCYLPTARDKSFVPGRSHELFGASHALFHCSPVNQAEMRSHPWLCPRWHHQGVIKGLEPLPSHRCQRN